MAGHAQLKFVMTECSKTQIRLMGLILSKQTVLYFSEICFVHSFLKNDKILSDTKIGSDQLCIVLLCYLNGVIGYVLITSAQWLLILSHYKQIRIDGRC